MRRLSKLQPAFGLLALGLVSFSSAASDEPPASAVSRRADEVQEIIFMAEERPRVIRLHIQVDGQPFRQSYREAWHDYVTRLFQQLDHHGSGFLTEAEAALLPPAQPVVRGGADSGIKLNTAFNFRVVDADGDGKVSLAEVLDYYKQYGGDPLLTRFAAPVPTVDAELGRRLFARLDTNHNGELSRAELQAAASLLESAGSGDEMLTARELGPTPNRSPVPPLPRAPRQGGSAGPPRSPFLVPPYDLALDLLSAQIRTRSGSSDQARGAELLMKHSVDVEIRVRLGKTNPGESSLEVLRPQGPEAAKVVRRTSDGTLLLTFDNTVIELRCNDSRPSMVEGTRQHILERFRAADRAGKGRLSLLEAQEHNFFPAQFTLLDRNADGLLTEKELLEYLDEVQTRQARAATSTTVLLISAEGRGLFDLLDRNRDGRLGLRELRAAPELLTLLGREKEGTLTADDLPRSYRLAVGLCDAGFERSGGRGTFSPRGMPLLALDWSKPGLAWFHKMDRNHDGDISRSEFLGSREAFDRLDRNGDGLISLEEAELAVAQARTRR